MDARKTTKKTSKHKKVRTRPVYHESVSAPHVRRESVGRPIVSSYSSTDKSEFLKTSSVVILVVTGIMFVLALSYVFRKRHREGDSSSIYGCPSCPKTTAAPIYRRRVAFAVNMPRGLPMIRNWVWWKG